MLASLNESRFPKKRELVQLNCPQCGGLVRITTPGVSQSAVCQHCGTIVGTTLANKVLGKIELEYFHSPKFEIDQIIVLEGSKWRCTGYGIRCLEDESYAWEEYVFHNPFHGFLWILYNGCYYYVGKRINTLPKGVEKLVGNKLSFASADESPIRVELQGRGFTFFEFCRAKYNFLKGEFYWQAEINKPVAMTDFVHAADNNILLSVEAEDKELNFTAFRWLPRAELGQYRNASKELSLPGEAPFLKVFPEHTLTQSALQGKNFKFWMAVYFFAALVAILFLPGSDTVVNVVLYLLAFGAFVAILKWQNNMALNSVAKAKLFLSEVR